MIHITEILTEQEIDEVIKIIRRSTLSRTGIKTSASFLGTCDWMKEPDPFKYAGCSNEYYFEFVFWHIEEFPEEIKNKLIAYSLP